MSVTAQLGILSDMVHIDARDAGRARAVPDAEINALELGNVDAASATRIIAAREWRTAVDDGDVQFFTRAVRPGDAFEIESLTRCAPLRYAALIGDAQVCRALIKLGVDVNAVSNDYATPLSGAASRGRVEICRLLVAAGANPSFVPPGPVEGFYLTPFQRAVFQGQPLVVRYFLEEAGQKLDQVTRGGLSMTDLAQSHPAVLQEMLSWETRQVLRRAMSDAVGGQCDGDRRASETETL
jgi:hypothetical protein